MATYIIYPCCNNNTDINVECGGERQIKFINERQEWRND